MPLLRPAGLRRAGFVLFALLCALASAPASAGAASRSAFEGWAKGRPSQPRLPQPSPTQVVGPRARVSCEGPQIQPGQDIQAALDQAGEGGRICLGPGVHRVSGPLRPHAGQTLGGSRGAVLSGAKRITFVRGDAGAWIAEGQTQRFTPRGECGASPACVHAEAVFIDDRTLTQVLHRSELRAGAFWFDYERSRIVILDDPTNRQVETTVADGAVVGAEGVDGVTVRGLIIERFGNPAQAGAVESNGGRGWVIEDNVIRANHGAGARTNAGARVRHNAFLANGHIGLTGNGADLRVEFNEIAHNNTEGFDPGWEGGGTKWVYTDGLVVKGNYVHGNVGPGLWTDTDNIRVLFEGNRVEDNTQAGIFHEAGYDAVVKGNTVRRNGLPDHAWGYGAGILMAHSPNVRVVGNLVEDNARGIVLMQQSRGTGEHGPLEMRNMLVEGNTVRMSMGFTGVVQDVSDHSYFLTRGIRFERNTYQLGGDARFAWLDQEMDAQTWRSHGQDAAGHFSVTAARPRLRALRMH